MTRRRNFSDKELDKLQRIQRENEKLKRENVRLRKEISKLDTNHFEHLRDLVDQQTAEAFEGPKSKRQEQKEKWECFECKEGTLKIIILNRRDGCHYFRKCSNCEHKTKIKKYTDQVEGIK
jgi:hypothetical protein